MTSNYRGDYPTNQKDEYSPGDRVEFTPTFEGLSLVPGSVYLCGRLIVKTPGGGDVPQTARLYYNHKLGAHALFENIGIKFQRTGGIESLNNYPDYLAKEVNGSELDLERGTTTPSAMELRTPYRSNTRGILHNCKNSSSPAGRSFMIKLHCSINKFNQPIPESVVGRPIITLDINRGANFLSGADTNLYTFAIQGLELRYEVMENVEMRPPLLTEVIESTVHSLQSKKQTISAIIPGGLTRSITGRIIKTSRDNNISAEKYSLDVCPGVVPGSDNNTVSPNYGFSKIVFSSNDNESKPLSYPIISNEVIQMNAIRSIRPLDGKYRFGFNQNRVNNGGSGSGYLSDTYMIGIDFGAPMSFEQKKLSLTLESEITSNDPYTLYLHARQEVEVIQ